MDKRETAREKLAELLFSPISTVGAKVAYVSPMLVASNMGHGDPPLSMVYVDSYGRFWKEQMRGEFIGMVCILDLRQLSHAIASDAA